MAEIGFDAWQGTVSARVQAEPLWKSLTYRKALYLYDCMWHDCEALQRDGRDRAIARQLVRSAGSISANLEEGYGRGYGKQRNWFYQVALGSARETKGWYWRAHNLQVPDLLDTRLALADEIIALLVSELQRQRHR